APKSGYTGRTDLVAVLCESQLPRLSSSPTDLTFDQTTSPGVFRLQGKRLRRTMEDLKKILYMI
ncbi:hypothetical protein PRR79_28680, partial [Klebsiella pneumoniae]|nr:hypothetical protein [Klebsiella pneumoniae]